MSLYTDLLAAGCRTDHHAGDLYVRDTPEARAILERHGKPIDGHHVTTFASDAEPWLEIPFAYDPFYAGNEAAREWFQV